MREYGPWKILNSTQIYSDPWLSLQRDDVERPDGAPGTYSVVTLKAGVCVLPLDADGFVYLTREFHYAVGRVTLECVSGGIDGAEAAQTCGTRELQEELGIRAETFQHMGTVDPFTASVLSPTQLYLATSLTFGADNQEGTEQIECVRMTLAQAVDRVLNSEITHAPSCVLILSVARQLGV